MIELLDVRNKYKELSTLLIEKNISITVMESCTSGLVSSLITDIDNTSQIFKGSFVSYSNEAKIRFGVNKDVIDKFGVYSSETSIEMAKACKKYFNSEIGIGITGTLGAIDKTNADSIQGIAYFAIDYNSNIFGYKLTNIDEGDKLYNKLYVANCVANEIIKIIEN